MKTNMITRVIFLMLTISGLTGCMNDEDLEESLTGEWTEVSPQFGRTTLIFTSPNKMTLIDGEDFSETYTYRIDGDEIYLSSQGSEDETPLYFDKLDPARFKIGYLYPSIPESDPEKTMTFEMLP